MAPVSYTHLDAYKRQLNFLAEYHVMGIFGRLQWHFGHTRKDIMQEALNPYWNYAHTCIKHTIDGLGSERNAL